MITNEIVTDYILKHTTIETLIKDIPQEYVDYIHSFLDIPFELENEQDREWIIYLYIIDTLKWCVENKNSVDTATPLLELLGTAFDHKPEYRVDRFYRIS